MALNLELRALFISVFSIRPSQALQSFQVGTCTLSIFVESQPIL